MRIKNKLILFQGLLLICFPLVAFAEKSHKHHDHNSNKHHGHQHHASTSEAAIPEAVRTIEMEGKDFEFVPKDITVSPGEKFALKLINTGTQPHMWEIEGRPETHVHAEAGEVTVRVVTAPQRPGIYKTICTEAGHEEAGMIGRLIVRE
jgi:plastocyanin